MKTYVVANEKGGIGKTTTALNLASILSKMGNKVLFIDTDRQCNSTDTYSAKVEGEATLYDVILEELESRTPINEAIQHTDAGDIVPSDPLLRKADKILYDDIDGIFKLKEALNELNGYDYVVIDTPPANNSILQNCLVAADEVIIPLTADRYSIQGLSGLNATIQSIKKRYNQNLKIAGILLIKFNERSNLGKEVKDDLDEISNAMKTKVFNTHIRECIKVREAQAMKKHLMDYKPNCTAAVDYVDFVKELTGK